MVIDFYYYKCLDKRNHLLYKAIYDAVSTYQKHVIIPDARYSDQEIHTAYESVLYDNPQFFYFDQRKLSYRRSIRELEIQFSYMLSEADCRKFTDIVNRNATKILQSLHLESMDEYGKVKAIHDVLAGEVSYAYEWLEKQDGLEFLYAHSILGVFCKKKSVCEGIAKAFKLLLNAAGIKCIVVSGIMTKEAGSEENHAWNIVKIDGKTYHVDPTNDICNSDKEWTCYDYFCLTDEQIRHSHRDYYHMPACTDESQDYFYRNHAAISNQKELMKYLRKNTGRIPFELYFRLQYGYEKDFPTMVKQITDEAVAMIRSQDYASSIHSKYNDVQRTIRLKADIRV